MNGRQTLCSQYCQSNIKTTTIVPRLTQITIEGFRSINEQIVLNFPDKKPVIIIGENNVGKSNIIRAIDLIFGEFHPKFKKLEDYPRLRKFI